MTLLERTAELAALSAAVEAVAGGQGAVVVLEAPAGLGKTELLDHAVRAAAEAGVPVRRVAPGPLERRFPYGVVRALLEAPARAAGDCLLAGPTAEAARLLLDGEAPPRAATAAHSIFRLCATLSGAHPLMLVVDDAQWADRWSLEALCYLARRVEEVPVLIAIAARPDDPDAASDVLSLLAGTRGATVLRPQPLSQWGAVELIRRYAPGATLGWCLDRHRAVEGSPWLLEELGRGHVAGTPVTADARDIVCRRMAALARRDRAVAAALAILGNCAPPHTVAALAHVEVSELAAAGDALRSAGLLGGGLRFAHGLIAEAVVADLTGTERERLHREAAPLLAADGCALDAIAGHLLESAPHGDPAVTSRLARAAADAAPALAVRYLTRALDERAPGDDRGRLLADLGVAELAAGVPGARRRLRASLREPHDRASRETVLTRLAALEVLAEARGDVADLLLAHGTETPAARVALLDALVPLPDRAGERARLAEELAVTPLEPVLAAAVLAHQAWAALEHGSAHARECAELALDALADDALLDAAEDRAAYHLALRVLVLTDHHAAARRAIDALARAAEARDSQPLRALAAWHGAKLALRMGDVTAAERDAREALRIVGDDRGPVAAGALEVLVTALAERGEAADEDTDVLAADVGVRHARARLWLATGRYELAHTEALAAGALREVQGRPNPAWTPWRSTAALALAHLGRGDEAVALADEEILLAQRFGAPVPLLAALHARAVAETDDEARIAICLRALREAAGVTAVLETARVRIELGHTLARTGNRVRSREALRPALAAADAAGATLLAERARRELVATGLRPRRAATEGTDSLTPRQREILTLAASGRGNREIARALFLSIKTVETHLAAGYRKLGIRSRAELGPALAV